MFILRKITGDGKPINFELGNSYTVLLKETHQKEFEDYLNAGKYGEAYGEEIYGFVISNGDTKCLFRKQQNYIMTDSGQTFENLTSPYYRYKKPEEVRNNLQDFKDYVHKRLDDAGVEKYPNGEHSKHGCRIGDRLDIVLKTDNRKQILDFIDWWNNLDEDSDDKNYMTKETVDRYLEHEYEPIPS